jgi:hypothetical protein
MYDRKTRSLWSQVNGKAVAGPRAGEQLQEIPSEQTTWKQWRTRHPNTLVLVKHQSLDPDLRRAPGDQPLGQGSNQRGGET